MDDLKKELSGKKIQYVSANNGNDYSITLDKISQADESYITGKDTNWSYTGIDVHTGELTRERTEDGIPQPYTAGTLTPESLALLQSIVAPPEQNKEEQLLFGNEDQFGIYQLKRNEALRDYRFESTDRLKIAGLEVDKWNYELNYVGKMEENTTLDDVYMKFNVDRPEDFTGHSLSVGDIVLLHQNGENTAQFVDSFGFTEIKDFLEKENSLENAVNQEPEYFMESDTERSYKIADRYISIHEVDEGFDYTIYDENYKELDGGVYYNPDIPLDKALNDIVEDLKEPSFNAQTEQYYHTEVQGNIRMSDTLVPVDYDELEEKVELANQIQSEIKEKGVVEAFKEKTKELFHEIKGQTPEEIEQTIYAHVQSQINYYALNATIVDVAVTGSRCRGIEQKQSDLDVVVELQGNEREDDMFSIFNEDGLSIGGVKVDIKPITSEKTGTLETYLPRVEAYLTEKQQEIARAKEVVEMPKTEVTLIVAECNEFQSLGELHEGVTTVDDAIKLFDSIPPERMHGIPSISVNLHTEGTDAYEDCEFGVLVGRTIDLDNLNYFNDVRNNPEAMDKIAEIIAKKPDAEIYGVVPPQIKDKIQEYRYEGMSEVKQLADRIDSFTKEYDPYEYADQVPDREVHLQQLVSNIEQGEVAYLQDYFQNIMEESDDQTDIQTAKEISDKLKEYKPLAKVEELEEQNYNMIDNVLNNGCEKFNKEKEKKGRCVSMKAKLEEKRRIVAGNSVTKEQGKENVKVGNREI